MALADMVWRTHAKYGSAVFLTACSYGFLHAVVKGTTPMEDARAWWSGVPRLLCCQHEWTVGAALLFCNAIAGKTHCT